MSILRQEDFIQSIADALQYISYYHPADYIRSLGEAYQREQSPVAKDAIAQILTNSRMCAEGRRPICQDTGIVVVFLKIGMNVRWHTKISIADMVNEGVRRAYSQPDNVLRASIVSDPAGARKNTRDNTPAVIHMELVPGDVVEVKLAAKGGGSENKSKFVVLNPSDDIVEWVVKTVPTMGAGWKPGETLLLSGKILTGRDAAHKRIADSFAKGQPLPEGVDFRNRFIYYVGPVDPVRDEVVGPAGPTTATRMDKFTEMMLEKTGLLGMIGKGERGPVAIEAIRKHNAVYLIAVGGAAYLVSKAIRSARVVAFADLGMEAIYEFEVENMPVTVAVDASGSSLHANGPAEWRAKIGKIPVAAG
ncbi:MAG TPA: FumA C-terminus/TtdB family hydratase beta subunit [Burkholderiales bacterium]|nr:FumA C-terminus/TtdB family hydratase beta subunit [Burkholderiales bacterium]